ncbi:MAG TPA: PHP domain-containing protein [Clostridiaceae bacterium]|nr:PHP domain-containing protein [Clostridiaceae bacterium]
MNKYKYDIHVHTSETSRCGKIEATEVVRLYKEAGYSGIVITDHYYKDYFDAIASGDWRVKIETYLKGYKKALEEGNNVGLTVLPGMEIRFNDYPNDYLVYGIDEQFLIDNPELYNLTLPEFKNLISDKNILIFQAHPFRKGQTIEYPELLDGVEVYNGNPRHDSQNGVAYKFAKENNLKLISGSDFHQLPDLARGGIIVDKKITTIGELVEVLRKNDTVELIWT